MKTILNHNFSAIKILKQIISMSLALAFSNCDQSIESNVAVQNEEKRKILIPDSIDVPRDNVIAAYFEVHPDESCTVIKYDDSTRSSVSKLSFTRDSVFEVRRLKLIYYNLYSDTFGNRYDIRSSSVICITQSGNTAMSAEYKRVDLDSNY